ncbi:hypothetical protein JZ751_007209, partial [Albula glossodonta]
MGDYGFGVLVQNNTGNKSAFPVRIHPHLQPPHHHQNASQSPAAFINNNTAGNGSNGGSAWLFPGAAAHSNMQDEILGSEKTKTQQQQQEIQETQEKQQQLSPGHQETGIISELEKARSEEGKGENGTAENNNGKEKLRIESPVLTGFDYQDTSSLGTTAQSSTSSSLTGFNNWSAAIPQTQSTIINEDVSFFNPAASANNGPLLFQNFSHHVSPGFGGNFSPQIGPLSQHHPPHPHFQHPHNQHQQHRRSPASPHPPPFPHRNAAFSQLPHLSNNLNKPPSPWGSYQSPSPTPSSTSWSPGGGYGGWGGSQGRDYRRGLNGGVTPLNSISPLKKTFPNNHVPSQKYSRTNPGFNPKSWMEESMSRNENIFPFQPFSRWLKFTSTVSPHLCLLSYALRSAWELTRAPQPERTRSFDGFNMHSLENSLIDIMRAEQDSLKEVDWSLGGRGGSTGWVERRGEGPGRLGFAHPGGDNPLPINGHSSLFPMEDGFVDDERAEQGLPGLGSPHCFPHQNGERVERYSRKVFVGGLPPDIDEDEITASFRRFGHLFVDWPHKAESKSYFPPKDGKLYLCVSSPTIKDKPVQIRPWNLNDSDFVMDGSQPLDPRKTIFVGGVPRPLRAVELAMIMDRLYGGVCYAGIDTDPELKYPKGAGRVAFSNQQSYIAAISARFVQLQHGEIDKR